MLCAGLCGPTLLGTRLAGGTLTEPGGCEECSNPKCDKGFYRTGTCEGTEDGYTCEPQPVCGDGECVLARPSTVAL